MGTGKRRGRPDYGHLGRERPDCGPNQDLWAIDATVLEQNGKRYLLWSGHGSRLRWSSASTFRRMSNPWTLTGPRVELSRPQYSWERTATPKVNEGPQVLKHNNKTFLVYSASHCSTDDYALGLLTASSTADPMLPTSWTKTPTPVFTKDPADRAYGPGHNCFFKSKDGQEDWIIYHANTGPNQGCGDARNPRMQKFTWNTRWYAQFRYAGAHWGSAAGAGRRIAEKAPGICSCRFFITAPTDKTLLYH